MARNMEDRYAEESLMIVNSSRIRKSLKEYRFTFCTFLIFAVRGLVRYHLPRTHKYVKEL